MVFCCLEFCSVATRLPPEFRLAPDDANELLRQEVFGRLTVHDLPAAERTNRFAAAARDSIAGGRIYDAHIVEVAPHAGREPSGLMTQLRPGSRCAEASPGHKERT